MAATYRAVMLKKAGGAPVLQCVELPIEQPGEGQLRVRVHAAGVGSPELIMLAGKYAYAPRRASVPGYEIAGIVNALGAGVTGFEVGQRVAAITFQCGYGELLVREAAHFLPIPDEVSDVKAAAVIPNYVTAWQMIHRVAKVRGGQSALVTGAAGGVGTAALQLLRLAGVKTYAAAPANRQCGVRKFGATPIDDRAGPIDRLTRALEPQGVDHVFDAVGGTNIGLCIRTTRRGGTIVVNGFTSASGRLVTLATFVNLFVRARLSGRRGVLYGITLRYREDPKSVQDDLPNQDLRAGRRQADRPADRADLPTARRQARDRASGNRRRGGHDRPHECLIRRSAVHPACRCSV